MRNLTITRQKSFVGSAMKLKVYIEDAEAQELTISGVPCRKLGTLKNGETAGFVISDQAARVFVIADKASRNYSNDYYPVPAGTEDVTIAGKNKYNPFIGNPFRFECVDCLVCPIAVDVQRVVISHRRFSQVGGEQVVSAHID